MTDSMSIGLKQCIFVAMKQQLHQKCLEIARQRAAELQASLSDLNESLDSESKSTAGDKHETGRAMIQLEQEQLAGQLAEAQKLVQLLKSIDVNKPCTQVSTGSLVTTSQGNYYIAAGLGKVSLGDTNYFVISSAAPLSMALLGASAPSTVQFNGRSVEVLTIE